MAVCGTLEAENPTPGPEGATGEISRPGKRTRRGTVDTTQAVAENPARRGL